MLPVPSIRHFGVILALLGGLCAGGIAAESEPADGAGKALLMRIDALEQQLKTVQGELVQGASSSAALSARVDKQQAESEVDNAFNFGGYGLFDYTYQHSGHSLTAQFQPIFTYAYRERFLFVGELNLDNTGTVKLTQAYMAYTGMAHEIVEIGAFPLPFAVYSERLSPAWVNKFADSAPAPYANDFGLFAGDQADFGGQVRGDIPIGDNSKLNYVAFVTSGPSYNAVDGSDDRLAFATNTGRNKVPPTVGGRIGYLSMPSHEMGFSAMTGHINNNVASAGNIKVLAGAPTYDQVDPRAFTAYAFDMEYHTGGFVLRGELLKVDFDDSTGQQVRSHGGYAQMSQRCTFLKGWANGFEPVLRGGAVVRNQPLLAAGVDGSGNPTVVEVRHNVQEVGVGINYYFTSYIRSSLFVLCHNDSDLNAATFTSTFAF